MLHAVKDRNGIAPVAAGAWTSVVEAWQGRSESVADDIINQNIKTSPRPRSMQVVVRSRPSETPT